MQSLLVLGISLLSAISLIFTPPLSAQTSLAVPPRLWWTKEQFGDKLIKNWSAYPTSGTTPRRIDLVVDEQAWSSTDYLERYAFVSHFGTVARDYGYNLRIFNSQKQRLATYTCNFNTTPRLCSIQLDTGGNTRT